MKQQPICRECQHMKMYALAAINGNNSGTPRGLCECTHKDAKQTFKQICPRSPRMPAFIGFTVMGGDKPQIKTSPRWCPLRFSDLGKEGGGDV